MVHVIMRFAFALFAVVCLVLGGCKSAEPVKADYTRPLPLGSAALRLLPLEDWPDLSSLDMGLCPASSISSSQSLSASPPPCASFGDSCGAALSCGGTSFRGLFICLDLSHLLPLVCSIAYTGGPNRNSTKTDGL